MKKFYLCLFLLILHFSIISSIEVSGHLIEDTIWGPDNNPYEVVDHVFVDAGVTLTILPGTEIKIQSAQLTCSYDFYNNFWYLTGSAKMIWVDGEIIAEGTEQDSIIFTRRQDDPDYYWGCIYITEFSEMPVFKHCIFEYGGGMGIDVGNLTRAVVTTRNGRGLVRNCIFRNNAHGFCAYYTLTQNIEVSQCSFDRNNSNNYIQTVGGGLHISIKRNAQNNKPALISHNIFDQGVIDVSSAYYVDNCHLSCDNIITSVEQGDQLSYFYNNRFISCFTGIRGGDTGDSLYIKNNRFIDGSRGIDIDHAYVEISDNYFEGCGISGPSQIELMGIVANNVISNTGIAISGRFNEIYNNIFYNNNMVSSVIGSSDFFESNLMFGNLELCNLLADTPIIENNIFINNNVDYIDIFGNPIFRNCIIDFPLEYPLIDGGGNIIVDSLQAQSIFRDIQNGDFHLAPGSIAIDAGFDTLGYYYPFDLDYNHRVWDGDGNGTAIIDIGPYEYGAPAFGGIQGITYDPTSGDFVDYVLIKINNQPGEFTFSDSIGSYEYKLPAGVYDVYAERVFFDDAVEYQIEVFDGQFTELNIAMTQPVGVEEHEIPPNSSLISHLSNYPNPFNPTTTLAFNISSESVVSITIYNLKGQKVKKLLNEELSAGQHTIDWDGTDENNKSVASGIYFYKIATSKDSDMRKMLLLK